MKNITNWAGVHERKWSRLLFRGALVGRVPSKKNSRRLGVLKTGRPFSIPSKAYVDKKQSFADGLIATWDGQTLYEPLQLKLLIWEHQEGWFKQYLRSLPLPTEPRGTDCDNKLASVQDILVHANIIADDCLLVEVHTYKMLGQKSPLTDNFGCDVEIYGLDKRL